MAALASSAGGGAARLKTCVICVEKRPEADFVPFTSRCDHPLDACRACLGRHAAARLDKSEFEIPCTRAGCGAKAGFADLERCLGKGHTQTLRFERLQLHGFLRGMDEFCWCAHRCGSGQLVEGGAEAANFFTCEHCTRRTCVFHQTEWHHGITCDEHDAALAQALGAGDEAAEADLAARAAEAKPCPGCGQPLSKAGGCDVMACCGRGGDDECRRWRARHGGECSHNPNGGHTYCGQRFCWLCLGPIDQDGTRHHKETCQYHFG